MNIELKHNEIFILSGPSSTGKSWFSQANFHPSQIVSSDSFRRLVADEADSVRFAKERQDNDAARLEQVTKHTYQSVSGDAFHLLKDTLRMRMGRGKLTVIDATNLRLGDILQYADMAKQHHVPCSLLVFDVPMKQALQNDETRTNPRGKSHIRGQYRQLKELLQAKTALARSGLRKVWYVDNPNDVQVSKLQSRLEIPLDQGMDIMGDGHGLLATRIKLMEQAGYKRGEDGLYRHPEGRKLVYLNDETSRGSLPDTSVEYGAYPSIAMMVMMKRHVEAGLAYAVDSNHNYKVWRWLEGRGVSMRHGDEVVVEEFASFERKYGKDKTRKLKSELAAFLKSLPSHYVIVHQGIRRAVVAHAGIRDHMIGKEDDAIRDFCRFGERIGTTESGKPIRGDWTVDHHNGLLIIWGHDPHPYPEVVLDTINLDQGGFAGHQLTLLRYPEIDIVQEEVHRSFVSEEDDPIRRKRLATRFQTPRLERYLNGIQVRTEWGDVFAKAQVVRAGIERVTNLSRPLIDMLYVPPTMSPPAKPSTLDDFLEHPQEAFQDYQSQGVEKVVVEQKHMGSRAVILLFRTPDIGKQYLNRETRGMVRTRSNLPFFPTLMEQQVVDRLCTDFRSYFDEMNTDLILLDAEILPWSYKAAELIRREYSPVATGALYGRVQRVQLLREFAAARGQDVHTELDEALHLLDNAVQFKEVLESYCANVKSLNDIQIAPFHVLAFSEQTNFDKTHLWHMKQADRLASLSELLIATPYRIVHLDNQREVDEATTWWLGACERGMEGIVVKPYDFVARGDSGRMLQPALKVRGREYLRLIYGMDYLEPDNLSLLKAHRSTEKKMKNARKEFILSLESVRRFIEMDSLERIHECVLAAISLECDPIDPRL